jgi:hypothetical protein
MKINRLKFAEALEIVKPGLALNSNIEQAASFAFANGKVITYNDEVSLSHPVEDINISGAIDAPLLIKYLGKLKQEEIEIKVEEKEIIITAGRSTAGFALQSEIKLPIDIIPEDNSSWDDLPENFSTALEFASGACADSSMDEMNCVHIHKSGFVEGTDGFRIAHFMLGQELLSDTFLLPATSAIKVIKLEPDKILRTNEWVHFKCENGTIISCRILTEEFPDTATILNSKGREVQLPKVFDDAVDRAIVFAKRQDALAEILTIELENNRLILSAKSDISWFKEVLNVRYTDEKIKMFITPSLLKDILTKTKVCEITENKLIFKGENWIYITMLRD